MICLETTKQWQISTKYVDISVVKLNIVVFPHLRQKVRHWPIVLLNSERPSHRVDPQRCGSIYATKVCIDSPFRS